MRTETDWPVHRPISSGKEEKIAKLLFETQGAVPMERLSAAAGKRDYAIKVISTIRTKLLPGYQISPSGAGYQLFYPTPEMPAAEIKPSNVPYLIAIDVVNERLQVEYEDIAHKLLALDEQEQQIRTERARLELKRQTLEYAMLGLAEIMQPLPTHDNDSVTLDRLLSPEVR